MKIFSLILVTFFLLHTPLANAAGIQKWVDENGQSHYGERPPSNQKAGEVKSKVSVVKVEARESSVVLYSTSRCGYCKKAKAFMNQQNIKYREYDIEKNAVARSEYKRMGGKAVPLLVKQGRTLHGFSKQHYERFFGL